MKKSIRCFGIIFIFIIVITSLYGCGRKIYSLEGDWEFASTFLGEQELTKEMLEAGNEDPPTLKCTKNEFTLIYFDTCITGTWESTGDDQYSFFLKDGFKVYSATLKVDGNKKQMLTLKHSDEMKKEIDDSNNFTMEFER